MEKDVAKTTPSIDLYDLSPVMAVEENVWISGTSLGEGNSVRGLYLKTGVEAMTKYGSKTGEMEDRDVCYLMVQTVKGGILSERKTASSGLVRKLSSLAENTPVEITFLGEERNPETKNLFHNWSVSILGQKEKKDPLATDSSEFEPFI